MKYTNREKEFIYAYVKSAERRRRNSLPYDWQELKDLRDAFGIDNSRSTELIENAEFYGLLEPQNSLRKNKIVFDYNLLQSKRFEDLEKFDEIISKIYLEFESLSTKAALMADEYYKFADSFLSVGIKKYKNGNKKEAYIAGGIGAIIAGLGYLEEQKQLKKIEQEKQRQLEKIRRARIDYAENHLETINRLLEELSPYEYKYNDEYYKQLTEKIEVGNTSLVKVNIFVTCHLGAACRSYYQLNILKFFKTEMEAWLNGYDSSKIVPLTFIEVVDLYVSEWPRLLNIKDWDNYISDNIMNDKSEYYLPIYSLFANSFLFRNYVGVELPYIKNTEKGLMKRFVDGQKVCNNIELALSENIYYKKTEDLFLRRPSEPHGISGKDNSLILLVAFIIVVLAFVIWKFTTGFVFFLSSLAFCLIVRRVISSLTESMPFVNEYNDFIKTRKCLEEEEFDFAQNIKM